MKLTDATLLRQMETGCKVYFFNILYDRYNRLFYRWIYTRIGCKETTEEIAQNFWVEIWENPSYFKNNIHGSVKDYFLRVLSFRMLDYLKSSYARKTGDNSLLSEIEKSLSYTHILEEIHTNEVHTIINGVLDNLPQLTKDICALRLNQQYTVKEAASALKVSPKIVRTRYRSVLAMLKERLVGVYSYSG
ncbi:MAG: sigma-70 family RNA polymerase sigma factor [Proteiniphilum sp.]|jgi:RNA polymerase sigma factor (sigma-70 family)|uniref:RNA polymerase sigma factor n=1 Tax=Proteiniphilum sp. TaxID=1926877 RepID=UPI002B2158C2|nr:sigma-70 family RNA polymerase sigma factor [Proteiniphilum sp.]MEA5129004.1 sigma-70 family RNA polymerase sigma factor [Proteiniphilum sp.]